MPQPPSSPRRFLEELKRRRVFRVAAAYAAVAFVLWQVAEIAVPALRLPIAVLTVVVLLTLLGFPVALVLAWAFEVRPESAAPVDPEPERERVPERPLPVSRSVAVGIGAALVSLAGLGVWLGTSGPRVEAPEAENVSLSRVAILPFAVRGEDSLHDLGLGLVDLLSITLDGAGEIRTTDPYALLGRLEQAGRAVADRSSAEEVAASLGAGTYVLGSLVQLGERLQATATVYQAGGREIARVSAEAVGEAETHALVDELARKILSAMPGNLGVRPSRLGGLTTDSIEALKAYLEGERRYRATDFAGSIGAFQRAVAADSTFALGYYRLALAAAWNGDDPVLAAEASDKALRYADRLPDRDRRLVQALHAFLQWDWPEAERRYGALVGTYPDDLEAWYWLGEGRFHASFLRGGSLTSSREPWERVLALNPGEMEPLFHFAHLAALEGRVVEADSFIRLHERLDSIGVLGSAMTYLRAVVTADEPLRRAALDSMSTEHDVAVFIAGYLMAVGPFDLERAREVARLHLEPHRSSEMKAAGYTILAHLAATEGRWRTAWPLVDSAGEHDRASAILHRALLALAPFAPEPPEGLAGLRDRIRAWDAGAIPERISNPFILSRAANFPLFRLYLLGLLEAATGSPARARALADSLHGAETTPGSRTGPADLARAVRAEIALRGGREAVALGELAGAERHVVVYDIYVSPPFAQGRERFLQGELLRRAGRGDDALGWYEGIGGAASYELAYWPHARLAIADIMAARGENEAAAREYRRVLELWRYADPEWEPRAADVRRRLEALGPDG